MTQHLPTNETLLMSDELEEHLGYLRDGPAEVNAECTVQIQGQPVSFRVLGWDTQRKNVTIEVTDSYLRCFFNCKTLFRMMLFDYEFVIEDTQAIREDNIWKVTLILEHM